MKAPDIVRLLLAIERDIAASSDAQRLCSGVVQTLSTIGGYETAGLYLSDPSKQAYILKASAGSSPDRVEEKSLPYHDPVVQSLSKTDGFVTSRDARASLPIRPGKRTSGEVLPSAVPVWLPLRAKGELIGILSLMRNKRQKGLGEQDREFLSVLAGHVALALENARMQERMRKSQRILRQASRLASVGQLTAGLVHEIRNPLTAIRTFVQVFPERYGDPAFRENFQAVALRELDRVCGLANHLLNFSRPSAAHPSRSDINEVIESVVRILEAQAKEKGVQIHCGFSPQLPAIYADREQIQQVFVNILLNAFQAIEGEGRVEITTRSFSRLDSEPFVQIEIRDNGIGIPETDLENVFRPFFTTKSQGSGLGLSISREIMEEQGGSILVESKVGEGTAFFINVAVQPTHR